MSKELLKAFGIGADDIARNREGRLGPAQARALRRSGINDVIAALVAGAVLAAILLFVANRPLKPAQWITASVLFGAALATALHHFRRTAAAADGVVEVLAGPVSVQSRGRNGWFLVVGGRSFRLPVRPWLITSDARYREYVVPRVGLIVGMEPE